VQALLLSKVCCVQTWGNRADALVRQAELLAEVTPAQSGDDAVGQAFAQAMQAYEKACSMTSSEQGDDLPGLLHNGAWVFVLWLTSKRCRPVTDMKLLGLSQSQTTRMHLQGCIQFA